MMITRTYKEHSTKWRPCAGMYKFVCSLGQTASTPSIFGGRLRREVAIDNRNTRH